MVRTKLVGRLIASGVVALALVLPAASTSAHSSSYCGHGSSGWWDVTEFTDHYTNNYGRHTHVYRHWDRVSGWTMHYAQKDCGGSGSW